MRKVPVPRDDARVEEIANNPEAYFKRVRDQVHEDAVREIDSRLARRPRGLHSLLVRLTGPRSTRTR
jgi:hypothetical protein